VIFKSKNRFPCFIEGETAFYFKQTFLKTYKIIVFEEDDYYLFVSIKNHIKKTEKIYRKVFTSTKSKFN